MKWANMTREQRIAAMKPLTAEGYSGTEIGVKLGTSKNAIIGMWHRHASRFAFPPRAERASVRKAPTPKPTPKPKAIQTPLFAVLIEAGLPSTVDRPDPAKEIPTPPIVRPVIAPVRQPTGPGISILDRQSHQCAWIMPGEQDGLALCCGEHTWRAGSAWCAYHARRVYVQPGDVLGKKSPERVAPTFLEAAE